MKRKIPNPRMMVLARESRGITQNELKDRLGVSQFLISKVEQGIRKPSTDYLKGLSQHLRYPESFFFEPGNKYPPVSPFHRKKKALPKKQQDKIEAIANVQSMHIFRLLESVEVDTDIIHLDLDEYDGDPRAISRAMRAHWHLPRGPVDNVTKIIEDAGIIIVRADFETSLVDGFTLITENSHPIIFINRDLSTDRMRFTLLHEVGHIVMHTYLTPTMEKEADLFASEFLMPGKEIAPYLEDVSIGTLANLKPYWKASMGAILMKASDLGKIDYNQGRYLWSKMRQFGYMSREPSRLDLPPEHPTLLNEILGLHVGDLQYSLPDMCKFLMIYEEDFHRWYSTKPAKLRIVK